MESQIRTFTFNNETVVLRSGKDLPKNEIIKRLNEMGFKNVHPSINKEVLENNYEAVLKNHYNKILIFNRLRQDTEFYFRKKHINQREYIDDNFPHAINPKSMFNQDAPFIDRQNKNTQGNDTQNSSTSPSIMGKIFNYLNNHKMDLLKTVLFIYLTLGFEAFLEDFAREHYIFREMIFKEISRSITPKGIILGFIFYVILNHVLGMFHIILGSWVVGFLIFINGLK